MVLSPGMYGPVDDEKSIASIRYAIDSGINFIDTADAYGMNGHNEKLVGPGVKGREATVIGAKFGLLPAPREAGRRLSVAYDMELHINCDPQSVRYNTEADLKRLGTDIIDIYWLHFPDPEIPIEDAVRAMAELVDEGIVRYIGICNGTAEHLRGAHETYPITAVQNEFSLWTREPEHGLLPATKELGVRFAA